MYIQANAHISMLAYLNNVFAVLERKDLIVTPKTSYGWFSRD